MKLEALQVLTMLLSVWCFVMFAVVTGVGQYGWSVHVDEYKEKLSPWIFSSVEFFLSYGLIFMAGLVVLLVVIMLSGEKKVKVTQK